MRVLAALGALLLVVVSGAITARDGVAASTAQLVAVGDVASCESTGDEATAALVRRMRGPIALLGDAAYDNGTEEDFRDCFMPSWGPLLPRIRAALGNHEYLNDAGDAAVARRVFRLPAHGAWYSYRLGTWHIVVLDSNCGIVGCGPDSAQWRWLRDDLARARNARCTLAYWHHPRFSSGWHGNDPRLAHFWALLAAAGADVVLAGHDHNYERLAPVRGIHSFVVGTGGRSLRPIGDAGPRRGSEVFDSSTYGVLRLTLRPDRYDWRFVPVAGGTFTDRGSARCR